MAGFTHGMSKIELDVRGKRFNAHARLGITFGRPARAGTEDGAGIGSRKGRGPTQWGGPAEALTPLAQKYKPNNVSIKIQTNTEDRGVGRRENRPI